MSPEMFLLLVVVGWLLMTLAFLRGILRLMRPHRPIELDIPADQGAELLRATR
ncbi:MAG: hypothetical protein KJ884_06490 [Gammaproteobacteria bacterium]|nr:hypothetical protein [Gammaproteobacteria bacterium]MBU1492113.1 hypothetical protein [Gammaproteobacteria bacterium]MBU2139599.1 hypothetical protein [Gammaproteobacteria bacterium]MBU2218674.1 hypothetical protein [Gammaproteobacteria bacterium]MBU2322596.1 hypothetical protein [Gammaproteobacteria bacterium]